MYDISREFIRNNILKEKKEFVFEMYQGKEPIEKMAKYTKVNVEIIKEWIKEFSEMTPPPTKEIKNE